MVKLKNRINFSELDGLSHSAHALGVLYAYHRVDVAAHVEVRNHFDLMRVEERDEIVGDDVRYVFVKHALVAKLVDVELQALEFHAPLVGLVLDVDRGEIGESRFGTQASKLGSRELNRIFAFLGSIREALELSFFDQFRAAFLFRLLCHIEEDLSKNPGGCKVSG